MSIAYDVTDIGSGWSMSLARFTLYYFDKNISSLIPTDTFEISNNSYSIRC